MSNLTIWDTVKQPPASALRQIQAGRLKGKSDINPQWRYRVMTEQFGVCGIGWKFEIKKLWTEPGPDNQVFTNAEINLYVKVDGQWSEPIPGVGGHMLIVKESSGLHANDEGYKMAITDALGTSMKMLGLAADVYAGLWDGAKYKDAEEGEPASKTQPQNSRPAPARQPQSESDKLFESLESAGKASKDDLAKLSRAMNMFGYDKETIKPVLEKLGVPLKSSELTSKDVEKIINRLTPEELKSVK